MIYVKIRTRGRNKKKKESGYKYNFLDEPDMEHIQEQLPYPNTKKTIVQSEFQ